jgi:hypothetical protein
MPLDILGRTRATLTHATSLPCPDTPVQPSIQRVRRASVVFGSVYQPTTTLLARMIIKRMCKNSVTKTNPNTFSNGCLGSYIDEERSKCDTSCELQNQRVIKTLNAPCTSFGEYVCWWSVHSSLQQVDSSICAEDRIHCIRDITPVVAYFFFPVGWSD